MPVEATNRHFVELKLIKHAALNIVSRFHTRGRSEEYCTGNKECKWEVHPGFKIPGQKSKNGFSVVSWKCHQYFLITTSSTQYTPVSNWSNRPLLSGVTAVVHGCSVCALNPSGESLHCRRDVSWSPPMPIMQSLTLSTLWSTPMKGHNQAAFHVRFIQKLVLEVEVVSQQYSWMQHTSPDTGL